MIFFIGGFQPPGFRNFVKKLGSTDIPTTLEALAKFSTDFDIYIRSKTEFEEIPDDKTNESLTGFSNRNNNADRAPCSHRLTDRPYQAHNHTDTRCFLLHPERASKGYNPEGTITPKLWYGTMVTSQVSTRKDVETYEEDQVRFLAQISNLEGQLSVLSKYD